MKKFTKINESVDYKKIYKLIEFKENQFGGMTENVLAYAKTRDKSEAITLFKQNNFNFDSGNALTILETNEIIMPYVPPIFE